jgi:hypothetical protein
MFIKKRSPNDARKKDLRRSQKRIPKKKTEGAARARKEIEKESRKGKLKRKT